MNTAPRVSIIILNWNRWKDTIECLESVYQITYPNYDVIVADNGSENESIEKIKEYAEGKLEVTSKFLKYSRENKPIQYIEYSREETETNDRRERVIADLSSWKKLILIKNGKNYGFAEGNNIAIRYVMKELNPGYVLLLNNDTVVDEAFLNELVNVAESNKKIGAVGPKTYYYDYHDRNDVISFAGGRLVMWQGKSIDIGMNEIDHGQHDRIDVVDYIEGSCLLARQETLEKVGLLDPIYFLYWEETDWCIRARNEGFYLYYTPKAKIWHRVSASNQGNLNWFYLTRNRFIFTKRYANALQYFSFLLYFFGYYFWFTTGVLLIYHRNLNAWESFIKGIFAFLKSKVSN